jgi:4'-phosphopantetheinyl transferase
MPKRRADWLLGRVVAKGVVAEALREAFPGGWRLEAIEIASEPGGRPYARLAREAQAVAGFGPGTRLPVSVSISHAERHALCAATVPGPANDGRALGIDLGWVEPRSPGFVATFFTGAERRFVRNGPASERDLRANLIWCAKEAVLKALGVGLAVDTRDVSCLPGAGRADPADWRLAPVDDAWSPFVVTCTPAIAPRGGAIRGIWRSFGGFVGALAAAPV